MRLDQTLAIRLGLSRNRVQFCIDSGLVFVNGKNIKKAALDVGESDVIEVCDDSRLRYVARSALKLAPLFAEGIVSVSWKECLDVGSSTGGFVQVLLENGATSVHGVDVGTNQLHVSLRKDDRIHLFEQTDIRSWQPGRVFDCITSDVSFISLQEVLPSMKKLLSKKGEMIVLFKPQFEVGNENLKKTGVPKNQQIIQQKLQEFQRFLPSIWLKEIYFSPSALKWEAGNQEYIFVLKFL